MREKGKMQISIHQIDRSPFGKNGFDDIAEIIVDKANKEEEKQSNWFKLQNLTTAEYSGFKIRVYHAHKTRPPKWRSFFNAVLKEDSDLMKSINVYSVFLAFLGYEKNIYAISGGSGNTVLHQHNTTNLGTEILTRIIKKDDKVIHSLKDRSFTGNILGHSKTYKDDQRMTDEDQFGKIYNEVKAELNRVVLTKIFGFSKADLTRKSSGCIAHASFQINKRIDFKKLLDIIIRINKILVDNKEPNFSLNDVIYIDKRHAYNQELRGKLETALTDKIFSQYKKGELLDFDFCHPKYEDYYNAVQYKATRDGNVIQDYEEKIILMNLLKEAKRQNYIEEASADEFYYSFLQIRIDTYDSEGDKLTSGTVYEHLNGEIRYDNATYFYLGREWYKIKSEFIAQLNRDCNDSIKQYFTNGIIRERFNVRKEDDFIAKHFGKPNFIVLHKVLYDNIELCDLLYHDESSIHLVHIKKGFDNSIRELASQISMAAKRLIYDRKQNCSLIGELDKQLERLKRSNNAYLKSVGSQNLPTKGLAGLVNGIINDNHIIFCLAFVDTSNIVRNIKDSIEKFDSSIAKHSILELRKVLMSYGFGFKIIQLEK